MKNLCKAMLAIILSAIVISLVIIITPAVIIQSILHSDEFFYSSRVRSIVPNIIKITGVVSEDYGSKSDGKNACGGMAFELSEDTLNDLEIHGLAYLKDATPVEEIDSENTKIHWKPWRKTPVPEEDKAVTILVDHGCVDNFEKFLEKNQYVITSETEAYYSFVKHGRSVSNLWLFPEFKLVVFNYWH